jgi:hypothetical protein
MERPVLRLTTLLLLALATTTTTACGRRAPRTARYPQAQPESTEVMRPQPEVMRAQPEAKSAAPSGKDDASQMSEPEKKAAARAAYAEGVQLQTAHDCAHALPRFEAAQRLFDAPTHVLHIAQCQAETGMLLEAQESYSTLSHVTLPPQAPAAFREAKDKGRAELARVSSRVPTLRVITNPAGNTLKNVVVQVNGTQMPAELIGVARPLNPGRYQVKVTASPNLSGAAESELKEGQALSLEVRLSH